MPLPRALASILPLRHPWNRCHRGLSVPRPASDRYGHGKTKPTIIQSRMCSSESGETDTWRRMIRAKLAACPGGSIDLNKCCETGIATVTINNPKTRNAFSGSMMLDLADVVAELEIWKEGKGLLVHGADGFFSSGGDLSTVWEIIDPVSGVQMSSLMQDTLQRLRRLPLISVSVIQGSARGGGAEIAMATDFRIMTTSSYLAFLHSQLKVSTVFGGGTILTRLVGRSKALDLLASGRHVGSEEALRIGLADQVVPNGENVNDFGKTWLSRFTQGPVEVVHGMKSVVMAASELSVEESLDNERRVFGTLWGSDVHKDIIDKIRKKLY
ncbi:ethylmalonyl-CoA decarboxylase-like [Lineus longissimus]|uniref:ethylmalonyl-CoA decarboxylase-like n=1 Tax=Lineus longissimus TaxID=88925 RepID=UPI00315D7643